MLKWYMRQYKSWKCEKRDTRRGLKVMRFGDQISFRLAQRGLIFRSSHFQNFRKLAAETVTFGKVLIFEISNFTTKNYGCRNFILQWDNVLNMFFLAKLSENKRNSNTFIVVAGLERCCNQHSPIIVISDGQLAEVWSLSASRASAHYALITHSFMRESVVGGETQTEWWSLGVAMRCEREISRKTWERKWGNSGCKDERDGGLEKQRKREAIFRLAWIQTREISIF